MRSRCGRAGETTKRVLALVAALALALMAGCSRGDDETAGDPATTTTDTSLAPPGTPIGDSGLAVPAGGHLAGSAFDGSLFEGRGWGRAGVGGR